MSARRTTVLGLGLGLAVAIAFALGACASHDSAEENAPEAVVPVKIQPLETRTFEDAVDAPGRWRSQSELVIAAPFAGVIQRVDVRVGDQVGAGQVVGSLTTQESQAALKGAELLAREARDPAARAEAERALRIARRDLVRVPLTASQSGVVVRRSIEPGTRVADGAEVLAVVPWSSLVFEAHVPQAQSARVRAGETAVIHEEGRAAREGAVQRVLPTADPVDQTTLVWVTPASRVPPPLLDHYGTASIRVGPPHDAAAVPEAAIVDDDLTGKHRIAVVDTTMRAHWVDVALGSTLPGWRELKAPALPAGTRVVIEGQRGLPDSARVSLAP